MNLKINPILVLLFTIHVTACCPKTFETVYCGPENTNPVIIHKNLDDHMPFFVKKREITAKSTIDLFGKINLADASTEVKTEVENLRELLNNSTTRQENLVRAALLGYTSDPCNTSSAERYFNLLDNIAKDQIQLAELESKLKSLSTKTNLGNNDLSGLLSDMKRYKTNSTFFLE